MQDASGSVTAQLCPRGYYSSGGNQLPCSSCPANMTTLEDGAAAISHCGKLNCQQTACAPHLNPLVLQAHGPAPSSSRAPECTQGMCTPRGTILHAWNHTTPIPSSSQSCTLLVHWACCCSCSSRVVLFKRHCSALCQGKLPGTGRVSHSMHSMYSWVDNTRVCICTRRKLQW
jgi:hypothetical protein